MLRGGSFLLYLFSARERLTLHGVAAVGLALWFAVEERPLLNQPFAGGRAGCSVLIFSFFKGEPQMPVVFIDAPRGIRTDAKRTMMEKITIAIDEAYHIGDTLVFLREHPIENVALDGRIQAENPKILEALKKISG